MTSRRTLEVGGEGGHHVGGGGQICKVTEGAQGGYNLAT